MARASSCRGPLVTGPTERRISAQSLCSTIRAEPAVKRKGSNQMSRPISEERRWRQWRRQTLLGAPVAVVFLVWGGEVLEKEFSCETKRTEFCALPKEMPYREERTKTPDSYRCCWQRVDRCSWHAARVSDFVDCPLSGWVLAGYLGYPATR